MSSNSTQEKVIATISYLTYGIGGFLCLILGIGKSHFSRYHIYQSLIMGLIFVLFSQCFNILFRIIIFILKLFKVALPLLNTAYEYISLGVFAIFVGLIIYCVINLWRDKYSWIKYLSPRIYKMV